MQTHKPLVRFVPGGRGGRAPHLTQDDLPKVRSYLRTDMGIPQIASCLGVSYGVLVNFINRWRLCNLKDRRKLTTIIRHLQNAS